MRKALIPVILALAAAAPLAQAAGAPPPDLGGMREHLVDELLDRIDATDAQRTQIEAIEAKYHPQFKALHQQLHDNHQAEEQLDPMSSTYVDQANALVDQRTPLMAQMEKLHVVMRQEIAGVLSDAQRAQLKQAQADFHHHHHHFLAPPEG